MNNKNGFAALAVVLTVVIILALAGGVWYYSAHQNTNGTGNEVPSNVTSTSSNDSFGGATTTSSASAPSSSQIVTSSVNLAQNETYTNSQVDFGNSPLTVDSGGKMTFFWTVPTSTFFGQPSFTISCASGVTMYDVTNNQQFLCGNHTRMVALKGSDVIKFTSTNTTQTKLIAQLDYPGEATPRTFNFYVYPVVALPQPQNLTATVDTSDGLTRVDLSWTGQDARAAMSNVYTYNIYRSTTPGFAPSSTNQTGETNNLSYVDATAALNPGTYYYVVQPQDRGGNVGPASEQVSVVVP